MRFREIDDLCHDITSAPGVSKLSRDGTVAPGTKFFPAITE
jgi:hypothetical protein